MPSFQPPTVDHVPPVLPLGTPGQDPLAYGLFRHYKSRAVGKSVLKIDGVYQTIETPTQEQVDSATEHYAGGHIHTVSSTVATALTAAGYTVDG